MKKIETRFPHGIDERMFFQDIQINQVPIMNDYYVLLNNNNYDRASDLLNNSDVFFYGAWLLNLFENRLRAIGEYLMKETEHTLTYYELEDTREEGMNWISEEFNFSEEELFCFIK